MGLLDLKSDLSKYRKPAPKTDLKKEAKTLDKNFGSKNPLADMAKNLQKPESFQQTDTKEGKNVVNASSLSGRNETSTVRLGETDKTFKREGTDVAPMPNPAPKEGKTPSEPNPTPEKTGTDPVSPIPTPEKSGQDVTGGPLTFDRTGTDVQNTSALQGRHLSAGDGLQANQIGIGDYFTNLHANGFTQNFNGPPTQFKIGTSQFSNYGALMVWDGIKNQDADGFTPFMQSTQYKGISGQKIITSANDQYKVGGLNSPQSFIDGHSGTIVTGNKKGFQPTSVDNGYSALDPYGTPAFKNDSPHIIGSLSYLNFPYASIGGNNYSSKVPKGAPTAQSPLAKIYSNSGAYGRFLDSDNKPWLAPAAQAPGSNAFSGFRVDLNQGIDDRATGFKTFATPRKTYFVGANSDAGTYSYPDLVADGKGKRLMEVPIDPTDVGGKGIAKFATDGGGGQLGKGSPFASWTKDVNITKQIQGDIFTPFGYDKDNKYGGASGYNPATQESRLQKRYTENTPIDGIYGQFNLKDEAYNSGFIKQPFVTRGIQRAGVFKNQRWGLGNFFEGVDSNTSLPAGVQAAMDVVQSLDSGFMRGGLSTSIHRSIFDAFRLGQYMLTPDGLTFLAKQVGLQASNPKVETPIEPSPFNRRTRVYNLGLNTLASAAGNAFGLHFKRHGIVPVGERRWYYENVVKQRNEFPSTPSALADVALGKKNRLLLLRDEISMPKTVPGLPYLTLSGLAGPKSVYGIGGTAIRRYENTNDKDALAKIGVDAKSEYGPLREKEVLPAGPATPSPFSLTVPEVPSLKDKSRYIDEPLQNGDTKSPTKKSTGGQNFEDLEEQGLKGKLETSVKNDKLPNSEQNNRGEGGTGKLHKASEMQEINGGNYAVTPYDKIPKNLPRNAFNDFRETILKQQDTKDSKFIANTEKTKTTYNEKNLEKYFGFTQVMKDKTNYKAKNNNADKVNKFDFQKLSLDALQTHEDSKDLVKFWFAGADIADGEDYVLLFRATFGAITDNFKANWSEQQMIGRADPVYTYTGFGRDISFDFTVAATSRDEVKNIWRKLNFLASYTAPEYLENGQMKAPFTRLTMGDVFFNEPGFINSLTYTYEDNGWEIALETKEKGEDQMYQVPMVIKVNVAFTPVGNFRPENRGRFYGYSPGGLNTGGDKTNWLRKDSTIQPKEVSTDNE